MPLGKTPILQNDTMALGDANKYLLYNTGLVAIEDSINRLYTVDFTSGNVTLLESELLRFGVFECVNAAAPQNLVIPTTVGSSPSSTTNRTFSVINDSGQTITVTHGSGNTVAIADGVGITVHADGTDIREIAGSASFLSLGGTPGSFSGEAGRVLYVNAGETSVDFGTDFVWDEANGRLGINNASPMYSLDVIGQINALSAATNPAGLTIGLSSQANVTQTSGSSALTPIGSYSSASVAGTSDMTGNAVGGYHQVLKSSTAALAGMFGAQYILNSNSSATGTITSMVGLQVSALNQNVASTITSYRGIEVSVSSNAGTITDTYAVYVGDITAGTQSNTPYSFYASDANAWNYFAGRTGIGVGSPDYLLHLGGEFAITELSADPSNPSEGEAVFWMGDGTGTGDDGDLYVKITAGATTKTVQLVDFSAGTVGAGVATPYDIPGMYVGAPTSSEVIGRFVLVRDVDFAADFAGSVGAVETNPASTFDIDVQDDAVSIGTISISTGGTFTFTTTSGTAKTVAAGSKLEFIAPASVDANIDSITFMLLGTTTDI